jgi:hypothetical protein
LLHNLNNKHVSIEKLRVLILDLQVATKSFNNYELYHLKSIKINLMEIETQEGVKILPHFIHKDCHTTIHSTSNALFKLQLSQRFGAPMPTFTKLNAILPASIISHNSKILNSSNIYKRISEFEIDSIKFEHPD